MEKLVRIGILFDFYGKLLSPKQYQIIEYYYSNDLSLTEIGEVLGISRQGVFDTLKRAEEKLIKYEEKLGLVDKFYESQDAIRESRNLAREISIIGEKSSNEEIKEKAKMIENLISDILL
ncbi:YlxM family DNA-binding protein [Gudongella sp. DL1XJH-153]|uniref:YlxM family DNA-binding protein n=1 Tax=Gudongella sp. DL1XJH-153 TaxID=3409804 RepID=UPI003BB6BD94